ncbi:MAG: hypothetical protein COX07_08840 [Bacteroidetes bacterium CG23_combo_of_CG06-09_8_20_14_all_32_9]|nr:MAG: hypothetical protein COX07_08840 [Bacteroidetes bacterium CG23_combo_of_CG06-09_8_20_14_all_32_9]
MFRFAVGLILLFFFFTSQLFAQSTYISFNQNSYTGDSIFILTKADFISNKTDTLYCGKVNESGNFECKVNTGKTISVFIPLDFFRLTFYIEPGKTYKLQFPSRKKLSVADELNPFFEPVEIIPEIEGSDSCELNSLINCFDKEYDIFLAKKFIKTYYIAKKSFTDSAIYVIEKKFIWAQNPYFKTYMKYKISKLKFMAYERDNNFIIKYNFNNNSLYLNNTAYMDMFNCVFAHYFSVSATKSWGAGILEDIAKAKSPAALKQTFKNNPALSNDTLIDMIILKGLHDAFYDINTTEYKSFPRKQLLMTLDSMTICAKTPELKQIAKNIQQKVNFMISSSNAPSFALLNQDSVRINLSELRGKYLYINFTDLRSYSCANELSLLKTISEKFAQNLDVVTIFCNGSVSATREFCNKNSYKWIFLTPENTKQIVKTYNVIALPSYFLIDPYGKIILSPAPSPDANFEHTFISILRKRN